MNTDKIFAEAIANEYSKKETSKALKKLDNKVKTPVNIFTYTFGIISALILGLGMCLCMKVIGDGSTLWFIFGIIIGLIGILGASTNYFFYKKFYIYEVLYYKFSIINERESSGRSGEGRKDR